MDHNQQALFRFHLTPGLGRSALFRLHAAFGDFAAAPRASDQQLRGAGLRENLIEGYRQLRQTSVSRALNCMTPCRFDCSAIWTPTTRDC